MKAEEIQEIILKALSRLLGQMAEQVGRIQNEGLNSELPPEEKAASIDDFLNSLDQDLRDL